MKQTMPGGYACQNCLYQTNAALSECPQCGLRNIFIRKAALPYFTGRAQMPSPLQCLNCEFPSIHQHKQCPRCTKKYATGQTLNKLVTKGRYRGFHAFWGFCCIALGIFLGVVPFAVTILYQQKVLTKGVSDFHTLVFLGFGVLFIIWGISSWYKAIFK